MEFSDENSGHESRRRTVARHLKETRALEQQQKKELQKCKGKAERKELQEHHMREMESLAARQSDELNLTKPISTSEGPTVEPSGELRVTDQEGCGEGRAFYGGQPKEISKSQKKKMKKQIQHEEIMRKIEENKIDASYIGGHETEQIECSLRDVNLSLQDIKSDGHCMFRAIEHQLKLLDIHPYTYMELRELAATFLLERKHEFEGFFHGYAQDDTNQITSCFEGHCKQIRDSSAWGGELELTALSQCLGCDIEVYSASSPKITYSCGVSGVSNPIRLSFHRFQYASGKTSNCVI